MEHKEDPSVTYQVLGVTVVLLALLLIPWYLNKHTATTPELNSVTPEVISPTYSHHSEYVGELGGVGLYFVTITKEDASGIHILDHATISICGAQ